MHLSIYRFDPEKDKKPSMQEYDIDPKDCDGVMLLDVLIGLKRQDPTLSFRRSCGEGVCGSDGMNINGRNGLACITPISELPQNRTIVVRPLPGMPVVRDLVVDMTNFIEQYKKVKPFLQNETSVPSREFLQSPKDREKLDGLYECILCGCCSSACPSYWWNPEKFLGPAAALQGARFIFDSRDDKTEERLADLEDPYKIFRCRSIMSCADACPKGLNPTKAIGDIRRQMLDKGV